MRSPGWQRVNEPGVHGLLSASDDLPTRLLVTDDQAYDMLAVLLQDARAGTISVFAAAARCTEIVMSDPAWKPKAVTAMICRDLRTVAEVGLASGLTLRPVRRLADDPPGGVPLADAVAVAMSADSSSDDAPDALADYLRSLPSTTRLFAAVDGDGTVRATSGCGVFGAQASVFFVNTDPGSAPPRHRACNDSRGAALRSACRSTAGVPRGQRCRAADLRATRVRDHRPDDAVLSRCLTARRVARVAVAS